MVENSILIVIITVFVINSTKGFVFSPKPNYVLREPDLNFVQQKYRSSYFGFSILMRESSVIIGAPRAQSNLVSQKNINETGAIYKCTIPNLKCVPFIFDNIGNIDEYNIGDKNSKTTTSEMKDHQWLGASMDGGTSVTDKMVACAPRLSAHAGDDTYAMHGICYLTQNTQGEGAVNLTKINPLRLKVNQVKGKAVYHILGGQGLSVHVTMKNDEIIIGAPGIDLWKGSIIRYNSRNTVVLKPETWYQNFFSYFGYSVGSGYFKKDKILYAASAPKARKSSGEVYLFDIDQDKYSMKSIRILKGTSFAEFFGYAILAEDLNGDDLTDIIVTAPLSSPENSFENGVIYVYMNKGNYVFDLKKTIKSPVTGRSRFGLTISKLGDINHDGFNDVAVGAPFHEDGSVFIYLGGPNGLREVHSQQFSAPLSYFTSPWGRAMFGHGLAKGSDIDGNGFNDLAIGAPNAESVFVYRAYPVVKINASIVLLSQEMKLDQTEFEMNICYRISTTSQKLKSQAVALRLKADYKADRVKLLKSNSKEYAFTVMAELKEKCEPLEAKVERGKLERPIELELHYDLVNKIPDSEVFCETCAVTDPDDPKKTETKIIFNTGCKYNVCHVDLKITSSLLSPFLILGSQKTLSITYEVTNSGEIAYLPKIQITSSNKKMSYFSLPSFCSEIGDSLRCDLNNGGPLLRGTKKLTVVYDVTELEGTSITLTAAVKSTGRELNQSDNKVRDVITLREFTEIEVIGKPLTPYINLEEASVQAEIINNYEIKSSGPSKVQELDIVFEIPIAYKFNGQAVPLIEVNNINIQGVYRDQIFNIEGYQDKSSSVRELTETSSPNETGNEAPLAAAVHRNRRRSENEKNMKTTQNKSNELFSQELKGNLPINRTIVFSCLDPEKTTCHRAVMKVNNFVPDEPLNITLMYHVDLEEVNKVLAEPWEFFVIIIKLDLLRAGDFDGKTTNITKKMEYNLISKHQLYTTPLWIIILAILGGLLILAAMAYAMQKVGFFRRKTKEEMDRLIHEQDLVPEIEEKEENEEYDENEEREVLTNIEL